MRKIRIGLSATFTGRYDVLGKESFRGILLWCDEVNSRGGIFVEEVGDKLPVELVYEDDRSEPEETKRITKQLLTERSVDIVLGPYSSSLALAAAEITALYDTTLWNYGGSSDEITSRGYDHIISTITPAGKYFSGILDLLKNTRGSDYTIALAYAENSGFSTTVAGGLREYAQSSGFKIHEYGFLSGEPTFNDLIDRIESDDRSVIFFVGRFDDDVNFAKNITAKGTNFDAIALVGASIEEFGKELAASSNGFISTSQWDPKAKISPDTGPTPREFINGFQDKFRKRPDYLAAQAYNIGIVLEKCIELSGTLDDHKLREQAKSVLFRTFYGDFEIDRSTGIQKGHKMLVIQWQNNEKEIVWPDEYRTSELRK